MALEDLVGPDKFICNLVRENPEGSDPKSQGDDHIRGIKNVLLNTYPNVCEGAIVWTVDEANAIIPALLQLWNQEVGKIVLFPLGIPAGSAFAACDGGELVRDDFPLLYAYLGDAYGNGDGFTTFNLPDYRGAFVRGTDLGRGNDPDSAGRQDRGDGTTGDAPGTTQADQIRAHTHTMYDNTFDPQAGGANNAPTQVGNSQISGSTGGNETRPINIYANYGIKIDQEVPIP